MLGKKSYKKILINYANTGKGTNINLTLRKKQIQHLKNSGLIVEATELYDDKYHYYCEIFFTNPVKGSFSEELYNLYLANKSK